MTYLKDSLITRLMLDHGRTPDFPTDVSNLRTITLALQEHQRRGGVITQVMAALKRQGNRTGEKTVKRLRDAREPNDYIAGRINGQTRYLTDYGGSIRLKNALQAEWVTLLREASAPVAVAQVPDGMARQIAGGAWSGKIAYDKKVDKSRRLAPAVLWIQEALQSYKTNSPRELAVLLGYPTRSRKIPSNDESKLAAVMRATAQGFIKRGNTEIFCAPEEFIVDLRRRIEALNSPPRKNHPLLTDINWIKVHIGRLGVVLDVDSYSKAAVRLMTGRVHGTASYIVGRTSMILNADETGYYRPPSNPKGAQASDDFITTLRGRMERTLGLAAMPQELRDLARDTRPLLDEVRDLLKMVDASDPKALLKALKLPTLSPNQTMLTRIAQADEQGWIYAPGNRYVISFCAAPGFLKDLKTALEEYLTAPTPPAPQIVRVRPQRVALGGAR